MKKFLALLIAAMLLLGSVAALADPTDPGTGTGGTTPATTVDKGYIPLTKTLYFKNAEATEVYEPNITYTYEVSVPTLNNNVTVTDNAGHTTTVKPGNLAAFTSTTMGLEFHPNHPRVAVAANGTYVTKKNSFEFDGTKITNSAGDIVPGVYRYIITETTTAAAKNEKGIVDNTTDKTLVLDVYVKADGSVLGSVIHDPTDPGDDGNDDTGDDPDDPNANIDNKDDGDGQGKAEGFGDPDPGDDPNNPSDGFSPDKDPSVDANEPGAQPQDDDQRTKTGDLSTAIDVANFTAGDLYVTYNMEVSKTVDGALGDKSNRFPFAVTLTNWVNGAPYSFMDSTRSEAVNYGTTAADYAAVKQNAASIPATDLKHGEKFLLKGVALVIAANTDLTATVVETNNLNETYTVTANVGTVAAEFDATASEGAELSTDKKTATAESTDKAGIVTKINDATVTKVAYKNTLEDISLTGVVLRFAPYIAMLVAGAALIVILAAKRRKEDEEA